MKAKSVTSVFFRHTLDFSASLSTRTSASQSTMTVSSENTEERGSWRCPLTCSLSLTMPTKTCCRVNTALYIISALAFPTLASLKPFPATKKCIGKCRLAAEELNRLIWMSLTHFARERKVHTRQNLAIIGHIYCIPSQITTVRACAKSVMASRCRTHGHYSATWHILSVHDDYANPFSDFSTVCIW